MTQKPLKSKKYQPKPRQVEDIPAFKCPCGKVFIHKPSAIACCDAHKCDECDEKPAYTYPNLCQEHYNLRASKRARDSWDKSDKQGFNGIDYFYSDSLDKYMTEDDIYCHWEEDFPEAEFDINKAAEEYCLYLCEAAKPERLDLEREWEDALSHEYGYSDMPEGWEILQKQIDDFMDNMKWETVRETRIGLKV